MILEIQNLSASYRKKEVLKGISCSLRPGTVTALIGPNGAGKSTLVRCIAGQKQDYSGTVLFDDTNAIGLTPKSRAAMISCLPQDLPCPHVTLWELVAFGRTPYTPLTGKLSESDEIAVQKALDVTGLRDLKDAFLDQLSGGQQKKAFFAMTLAQDTPVVILDEPTAHLDAASRFSYLDLIQTMCRQTGKTFLVVMHELPEVMRFADRILLLEEGKRSFDGTPEQFLQSGLDRDVFRVRLGGSKETGYSVTPL